MRSLSLEIARFRTDAAEDEPDLDRDSNFFCDCFACFGGSCDTTPSSMSLAEGSVVKTAKSRIGVPSVVETVFSALSDLRDAVVPY